MAVRYQNRSHAGRILANHIRDSKCHCQSNSIVLGMPRGGVPVAYEVALELQLPFDVMLVKKIGAPEQPELAIGAVAGDNLTILDKSLIKSVGLSNHAIEILIDTKRHELNLQRLRYELDRPHPDLYKQDVILVDDGLATGTTMVAAIRAARSSRPNRIILAVPVAPPDTIKKINPMVDFIICPLQPENFHSVSEFYDNFPQTSDDEVKQILSHAG
ncbi:Putative phosphoribosyl transferase [Poriferisphaera corsica]|uniref:Phosphoribosyl transferase n=1 Tax=Poriferisphaera corsica TaxID=2528020 RepID=A0A517YYX0_9BACT|nr:phosphoribosyltransferase [Poriferisphaera corsica]QDU35415.1 Putative phosphoribosyl transferase [Poriferisphaera corsica]